MKGRPQNTHDDSLARELAAAASRSSLTGVQLAKLLGVSPATVSRAVKRASFSSRMRSAAVQWLAGSPGSEDQATISLEEALQILQNFDRKLPSVFKALSTAVNER